MTHCQFDPDFNEIFRWHFRQYAAAAGRQSLLVAAETETSPQELIRFAQYRFHDLLNRFTASFFDFATPHRVSCWLLGEPCGVATPVRAGSPNPPPPGPEPRGRAGSCAAESDKGEAIMTIQLAHTENRPRQAWLQ